MNKLKLIAFFFIGLLIGYVAATVTTTYIIPQTATIPSLTMNIYIDGALKTNGTTIDWGMTNLGTTYYVNLTVQNKGTVSATVYMYVVNLPSGWVQTWTANNTLLMPLQSAKGDLELTPSSTAINGTYNWQTIICATQT